jgi:hypothetical protein
MLDRLTYRQKFFGVMGIVLLLAVLSWWRGIGPTLDLRGQCSKMEWELDSTKASGDELQMTRMELDQLNAMLGSELESIEEINRGIMHFIGDRVDSLQLVLTDFPPVHEALQNQYKIYTHQAEVEGSFESILRLIYEFEDRFPLARICGVKLHTKEEFRTHQKKLYGIIYVQNIRRQG